MEHESRKRSAGSSRSFCKQTVALVGAVWSYPVSAGFHEKQGINRDMGRFCANWAVFPRDNSLDFKWLAGNSLFRLLFDAVDLLCNEREAVDPARCAFASDQHDFIPRLSSLVLVGDYPNHRTRRQLYGSH